MELKLVVLALLLVAVDCQLLPYEPVQYIRAQLPQPQTSSFASLFKESGPSQAADYMAKVKTLLKSHLKGSETSVVLLRGEKVMVQQKTKDFKWDADIKLPYPNTLSLVGMILPILLEGFKPAVIKDPIGKVLKDDDLKHPLIAGREDLSFLDLLNQLPRKGSNVDLESPTLLFELNAYGELALHLANAVLGDGGSDAWKDSMMGVGTMDMAVEPNTQLKVDVNSLLQLSLTVAHDLRNIRAAAKKERIPLDDGKYSFGWWFNCAKDCLIPSAPRDVLFSLSEDIRLYISPSLDLSLLVFSKKTSQSVADILIEDGEVWRVLVSAAEDEENQQHSQADKRPQVAQESSQQASDSAATESPAGLEVEKDVLSEFIHWIWPILVFVFWVAFSHVWVYWLLHLCWFGLTSVTKSGHIPRPKTAAEGRN